MNETKWRQFVEERYCGGKQGRMEWKRSGTGAIPIGTGRGEGLEAKVCCEGDSTERHAFRVGEESVPVCCHLVQSHFVARDWKENDRWLPHGRRS